MTYWLLDKIIKFIFLPSFMALLILEVLAQNQYLIGTAALLFLINGAFTLMYFRCPVCKKNVHRNPYNALGLKLWLFGPGIPEKCSLCGFNIDTPIKEFPEASIKYRTEHPDICEYLREWCIQLLNPKKLRVGEELTGDIKPGCPGCCIGESRGRCE